MAESLPPGEIFIENWSWSDEYDPPFHRSKFSPSLLKYYDVLFSTVAKSRVFVPLCGKTLDMIYLADKGHEVIGLEFSEIGINCFFKENNLTYTKTNFESYVVYKSNEKNITIYRGDIFDLNASICGCFDAIWDKGSYVAVNVPDQMKYTDVMHNLMRPNGKLLLEATTYDMSKYSGPPHFIGEVNLQKTFGRSCSFQFLHSFTNESPAYFPSDLELKVSVYLIQLKQ